jgi:hypothetical protein
MILLKTTHYHPVSSCRWQIFLLLWTVFVVIGGCSDPSSPDKEKGKFHSWTAFLDENGIRLIPLPNDLLREYFLGKPLSWNDFQENIPDGILCHEDNSELQIYYFSKTKGFGGERTIGPATATRSLPYGSQIDINWRLGEGGIYSFNVEPDLYIAPSIIAACEEQFKTGDVIDQVWGGAVRFVIMPSSGGQHLNVKYINHLGFIRGSEDEQVFGAIAGEKYIEKLWYGSFVYRDGSVWPLSEEDLKETMTEDYYISMYGIFLTSLLIFGGYFGVAGVFGRLGFKRNELPAMESISGYLVQHARFLVSWRTAGYFALSVLSVYGFMLLQLALARGVESWVAPTRPWESRGASIAGVNANVALPVILILILLGILLLYRVLAAKFMNGKGRASYWVYVLTMMVYYFGLPWVLGVSPLQPEFYFTIFVLAGLIISMCFWMYWCGMAHGYAILRNTGSGRAEVVFEDGTVEEVILVAQSTGSVVGLTRDTETPIIIPMEQIRRITLTREAEAEWEPERLGRWAGRVVSGGRRLVSEARGEW